MNAMYANVSGGFVFAGETYGEMLFRKVAVDEYADYFADKHPDLLCLSETHFEAEDGQRSEMMDIIARQAEHLIHRTGVTLDRSFLDTSKYIGMGIMSAYPIVAQENFTFRSPHIQVVRPNGETWTMLDDKGGMRVTLDVDGTLVDVVNFSYFAFHHFNRRVNEPEFAKLRQQLLDILLKQGNGHPTIITGDFNNKYVPLPEAFPELLADGQLRMAVIAKTSVVGSNHQLDHMLTTPQFQVSKPFAERTASDHYAIGAELVLHP